MEKLEKLIQGVRRLPNGAKRGDENSADAYQDRAYQRIPSKRLAQDQGRKDGVEDQARLSIV